MPQLKELVTGSERSRRKCKHAYASEAGSSKVIWCLLNLNKDCDHPIDPENCEYNIKGIEREDV